jgi:hypothetical protein
MFLRISIFAAILAVSSGPAWAADAVEPRAVASFARFELRDIRAVVEVEPKVINKIMTELKLKLDEPLARWNAEGAAAGHVGTLVIEVEILQIKFVSAGKRVFARAMAGGSSCAIAAKLVDIDSGKQLARKVFGDMSGGQRGAFTMGASDNLMLDRVAAAIGTWVIEQHSQPAPGPETEAPDEEQTEPEPVPAAG